MTGWSEIVPVEDRHLDAILDLNNRHAAELSWLERDELAEMVTRAWQARVIVAMNGNVEAFLLVLDHHADEESPNFRWFKARYPRFAYVDRIVVDEAARGRGHARRLYEDLFASAAGLGLVGCEVNVDPPNPASHTFHATLGFEPVGEEAIHGGAKTVRYYLRDLRAAN